VDGLRHRTWAYAAARNYASLDPSCRLVCVEDELGRLGAASGAAHIVYGIASMAYSRPVERSWFAAWALSPDGSRGLCVGEGGHLG